MALFWVVRNSINLFFDFFSTCEVLILVLLVVSTHPATDTFLTPSNHRLSLEYSSGKLFPLNDVLECHLCVLPFFLRFFWL